MLETLFASSIGESLTVPTMLGALCTALGLGLWISLVYMFTHKKEGYASGFVVTMIMLPAVISVIIMLIGNNVARAFSLAGAFSLIRFRSAPGDPKDIAYIFFTLAVGLGCGMGYLAYAFVFTLVLTLVMILLSRTGFAVPKSTSMQLKVTVPEDLNFQGLFDDVLDEYASAWSLRRIKTSEFGTLFEVAYQLDLKPNADQKAMIDKLRCRNGNLSISLTRKEFEAKNFI
ncbi:DUF4956 domain-containing protein [Papillibacter cinnamivorans]|uniref:DUF4956 domain-containing protein n=1 Tax=Papillibacter cinnamivorans DSM 12816 TaxID=1122930 RepID=A0A1W2BAZ7_9FIRM|nr:DUF4956 domain-containing protein [Papillibacter cinnamivorans]SMC70014.1 protein of unknown function [Papillibacter cinnamivorans DSM 12816]